MGVNFYFGGTSLLIVVGVAMDTVNQIESQLIMRHYDGFSRAPVAYAEGKPGNVFIEYRSRTGPGNGSEDHPGPILLMGAPGSGKGTQAKEVVKIWDIPQISTGTCCGGNVKQGTPLGKVAKRSWAEGTGPGFAGGRDGSCSPATT